MVICHSSPRKPIQCRSAIGQVPSKDRFKNRDLHTSSLLESALRNDACKAMRGVGLGRGSDELRCGCHRGRSLSGSPEAGMAFQSCLQRRPGGQTSAPASASHGCGQPHGRAALLRGDQCLGSSHHS